MTTKGGAADKSAFKAIAKDAATTRLRDRGDKDKIAKLLRELGIVEDEEDEDEKEK